MINAVGIFLGLALALVGSAGVGLSWDRKEILSIVGSGMMSVGGFGLVCYCALGG